MKGENICIFDCKSILRKALVLLVISIIWLNKISSLPKFLKNTKICLKFYKKMERSKLRNLKLAKNRNNFALNFAIHIEVTA